MKEHNYIHKEQERRLEKTEEHIGVINEELGDIKVDIKGIKTDVNWLKKNYWIVVGTTIGGVVVGLVNLLFR